MPTETGIYKFIILSLSGTKKWRKMIKKLAHLNTKFKEGVLILCKKLAKEL